MSFVGSGEGTEVGKGTPQKYTKSALGREGLVRFSSTPPPVGIANGKTRFPEAIPAGGDRSAGMV
jgi:hypothetical protein